jgi:periplasmic protein TonB
MNGLLITPRDRFTLALFFALALHAAIILGVGFTADTDIAPSASIEVTLSQYSEPEAPEQADFIAPTHQLGSGDEDRPRETTTTHEAPLHAPVPSPVAMQPIPVNPIELRTQTTLTTVSPADERLPSLDQEPADAVVAPPRPRVPSLDELAAEIASLEARIADEQQAQANQPRVRRLTSVSARSAAEAGYLNAWRQRVERIGNANYPPGGVHGNLRMLVVLRFDGALQEVRILESSGYKSLDDAALRIVRLAAPYPAFPVEMRKQYDQLEIIRTWQFSRSGARLDT